MYVLGLASPRLNRASSMLRRYLLELPYQIMVKNLQVRACADQLPAGGRAWHQPPAPVRCKACCCGMLYTCHVKPDISGMDPNPKQVINRAESSNSQFRGPPGAW